MSDTPRTDLSQLSCAHMDDQEWGAAGWDHARQLERELAEAQEELAETRKDYACLAKRLDGHDATECRANLDRLIEQLAEVTKQRDLVIEGLEKLASCDWVITLPDRMDAVRKIARQTIQIVKNNKH